MAARRLGVELPWQRYVKANEQVWDELWPEAPGLVGQTPSFADRVHEEALHRIGFEGPVAELVRSFREEALSAGTHTPFAETEETLTRLRERGIPLHIISGNVDYLPIIIANLGWTDLFETVTYTQEVGAQKPDSRVFEFALARAGLRPAQTVYVGDSWYADYLGARAAGMRAVWLNRSGREAPEPCLQIRNLSELEAVLTSESFSSKG